MNRWIWLLMVMIGAFWSATAHASPVTVSICIKIDVGFTDNAGGDIWTNNSTHQTARGVWLEVKRYTNGVYVESTWNNYADQSGCKTFGLWTTSTYSIRTEMKALVNGVPVAVYRTATETTGPGTTFYPSSVGYAPTSPTTLTLVIPTSYESSNLAVGTLAMYMNNSGLGAATPLEYDIYNYGEFNGTKYPRIRARTYWKYITAHETGHRVVLIREANNLPVEDQGSDVDNCDGEGLSDAHTTTSKEWYSTALKEGFADFYAAALWNDPTSDCEYRRHYESDFDLDGDIDTTNGSMSCEGIPVSVPGLASYVTARDWLEDLIDASDPAGCSGDKAHKSTQYDVLRYLWDMRTDVVSPNNVVPFNEIVDIYDDANPQNWNPNHNVVTPGNDPENRWYDAVVSNGYLSQHQAAADNGLDH